MTERSELKEQIDFCKYLDLKGHLYFAIPNGGKRGKVTADHLKKSGSKAGVPDLFICEPRNGFHGLFIEMKRENEGVVSQAQKDWTRSLTNNGYFVVVCHGVDEANKATEHYFKK